MLKTKISVIRKARLIITFFVFVVFAGAINAQDCGGFRNPNLDQMVGPCPDENGGGQVWIFSGWQQVTDGTSDGHCDCTIFNKWYWEVGICPPMRNFLGACGAVRSDGEWCEYVGQCLTTTWHSGSRYTVSFDFAHTRGTGAHTISVIGYKGTNCPSVPIGTTEELCGRPGWEILGEVVETSSNANVVRLNVEFTLQHDISYIAIGECKRGDWQVGRRTGNYFTFDNFCVASIPLPPLCFEASLVLSSLNDEGCPSDILSELIIYNGDGVIPAGTSLTFYDGDPRIAGATKLSTYTTTSDIAANATEKLRNISIGSCTVDDDFVYVVLGDDGSNSIPLNLNNNLANSTYDDCDYTDNISVLKLKKPCYYFDSVDKK